MLTAPPSPFLPHPPRVQVRLRYDDGDTDSVVLETDPIRLAAKDAVQWRFIDRPAGGDAAPAACGGHAQPEPATEGL